MNGMSKTGVANIDDRRGAYDGCEQKRAATGHTGEGQDDAASGPMTDQPIRELDIFIIEAGRPKRAQLEANAAKQLLQKALLRRRELMRVGCAARP